MAGPAGSYTVAAMSRSTGCFGLNPVLHGAQNRSLVGFDLFCPIVWQMYMHIRTHISAHALFLPRSADLSAGDATFVPIEIEGLTLQSGASGSPRSLPLPQRLGVLGRRQELINDNAWSTGGEEPRLAREQGCRGGALTMGAADSVR